MTTLHHETHAAGAAGPQETPDAGPALAAAVERLRALQSPSGWWKGELETNVTMDAEDLLLRQFLGIRTEEDTAAAAVWIRAQQRQDGSWATFHGGPPDLSTTIEAYVALRLAGDTPDQAHMRAAAEMVRAAGGIGRSRVFTRLWLALFGVWPWDELPATPPEVVLLPAWFPLNIYDFACWARQTIVPITVVASFRPVRPLPFDLDELWGAHRPGGREAPWRPSPTSGWGLLDRALHLYDRRPWTGLRRRALERAEGWILRRQERDGSWGGIQPPWVYSLLALHLLGYPLDHPAMKAGLDGLEGFIVRDERGRRLEACQSPVWDTALAVIALRDAGVPAGDPALALAGRWLVGEEIRQRGDWSVRRPGLEPSGWAFEFANVNYPDVDDTAEVVLALRRLAPGAPDAAADSGAGADDEVEAACRRAVAWTLGMQSRGGGWGAFDVDNDRQACRKLPFCDFGEVIDPPSADVTAHVVEMLAAEPGEDPAALARAVEWLWAEQEEDGSWFGRWGANHVYGTGAAVPALVAAGVPAGDPRLRRALRWLESVQNPDGGFGEDLRSYRERDWRGRGASTPSQTAWALLALLAAGERGPCPRRAVEWLVENQREDGGWDEPWFTGTGFPGDFYINYHLYRLVFPVSALGRWVGGGGAR